MSLLAYTTPQHVTEWGPRIGLTIAVLVVIALALWGMRRGWKRRAASQAHIPAPAQVPTDAVTPTFGPIDAQFLASTSAGQWLDRIVVHSLGVRSNASLEVRGDGLVIEREGEPTLFIPRDDLTDVRLDRGLAGEVYEAGSVVIVTWNLGETTIDTGLRPNMTADAAPAAAAIRDLLSATPTTSTGGSQ